MANVPSDLKYAKSHEWVRVNGDVATVGITDHAQHELTDVVFVELPEVGRKIKAGDACAVVESVKTASDIYSPVSGEITEVNPAVVESVKTASDIYSPVSGEITEVNQAVVDDPALVNSEPYEDGWFYRIKLSNPAELEALLGPEQYKVQISGA